MALFEDLLTGWGSGAVVGVGVVLAAPLVLPSVGAILRPVAKGLIKGYFALTDAMWGGVTETRKAVRDFTTEAQAERNTNSQTNRRVQTKSTRKRETQGREKRDRSKGRATATARAA